VKSRRHKTHFPPLFEFKSLNRAQQTKLLYTVNNVLYTLEQLNICKINYQLRTSDVTSYFMTSSVTIHLAVVAAFLDGKSKRFQFYWYVTSWIVLSQISHQDCAQSGHSEWLQEATVREHCSWEILARLDLYRTKQNEFSFYWVDLQAKWRIKWVQIIDTNWHAG